MFFHLKIAIKPHQSGVPKVSEHYTKKYNFFPRHFPDSNNSFTNTFLSDVKIKNLLAHRLDNMAFFC